MKADQIKHQLTFFNMLQNSYREKVNSHRMGSIGLCYVTKVYVNQKYRHVGIDWLKKYGRLYFEEYPEKFDAQGRYIFKHGENLPENLFWWRVKDINARLEFIDWTINELINKYNES